MISRNLRGPFLPHRIVLLWKILGFLCLSLPLQAQEILRGEVVVDLEPRYPGWLDGQVSPRPEDIYRRALEEGAVFFGGLIYGWSFSYDIGEQARNIPEEFAMESLGGIPFGDPRLRVTDSRVEEGQFHLWMDYHPGEGQRRRLEAWKAGGVRTAQARGGLPPGLIEGKDEALREMILKDAARQALRGMLRGMERNRPKAVRGFIALAEFPRFFREGNRPAVSARFRILIEEILPFAAY